MGNERVSLSVVIPLYNAGKWWGQLSGTLERQGLFDCGSGIETELILVDDGSTDNTPEMVHAFQANHPNVRYIRQPNSRQAAARARGLAEARMKYIYFMDQDDLLAPDVLLPLTLCAEAETADVVRFCFELPEAAEVSEIMNRPKAEGFNVTGRMSGREYIVLTGGLIREIALWSSIFRREFITSRGVTFDSEVSYSDDELFNWTVMMADPKVVLTDCQGYYWVQHPSSTSHSADFQSKLNLNRTAERLIGLERGLEIQNPLTATDRKANEMLRRTWRWHEFTFWAFVLRHNAYSREEREAMLRRHCEKGLLPLRGKMLYPWKHLKPNALTFNILWRLCKSTGLLRLALRLRDKI